MEDFISSFCVLTTGIAYVSATFVQTGCVRVTGYSYHLTPLIQLTLHTTDLVNATCFPTTIFYHQIQFFGQIFHAFYIGIVN